MTGSLRIGSDRLLVEVAPLGARLTSLRAPGPDGAFHELTVGIADDAAYRASTAYQGASIGRVANRVARGDLPIDGLTHPLAVNEHGNTLHGGPDGFDRRTWSVVDATADRIELALVSPDGDQGFPGTLRVRATFAVSGATLHTSYDARTDAPTAVSLASHPYFRLSDRVTDHRLRVAAASYLPTDRTGVPTGLAPVAGTPYDLREPRPVDLGFDHCWVLDGAGTRTVAELVGGGWSVSLATDQPGLQVYAGGGVVPGVALEPQGLPDAVHHPDWPSVVLRPGERYRWRCAVTVHAVTTRP